MVYTTQDDLLYLSSRFSKTLKSRFGKGPETCYVVSQDNRLFIYIGNFMTPAEEVLVANNQVNMANNFRASVINVICKEFINEASKTLGLKFHSCFHDWNYDTNKGIFIIESNDIQSTDHKEVYFEKGLFEVMGRIISKVHKTPERFEILKWNQSVCVVECREVLLSMDRYLFRQGYSDILLEHSREMKTFLKSQKDQLKLVFNREVEDLFIIWDYEKDRSIIVFSLQ
ncbi:Uncharacterized protein YbcI [Mesobacillus persicus]|uniref:Uncharacterized protein YbcI n=1 Tax=Mesobacillus persicus TaxID=930146 RepID=A0A1H8CEM1_9BACI|nr:Na-translocating system protein MpsC family protein [Mesobacillus persicus]SEM93440.1 Uncharacterized protein YbcI [Mesobacillus persicus]